ncbi:MAG: Preprotein translocase subunit SecE, preprotein translocase subunit SecE [Deltaproteobacteria bacterium CSP1-8]|jgi:preprotein translocase subunit SecE|nr:MAG: Preprotein translocase subunit SecE, preprotein translocase subunit SecE [Deltaproteobacteria bacterium CSP1-8]
MARSFKDRLFERLPGTRTATEETRPRQQESAGFLPKISSFYREFKTEMKKVTWPGRKETVSSTAVVIVTVLVIVLFLGLVDYALGRIVYSVLNF